MRWLFAIVLCALALAFVEAQRFNNFNNNNFRQNNFRPQNNNFRPQNNNFRQFNNNNNGRTFNFNNNNNNNNNRGSPRGTNPNFAFGLDTSDGRYAKFEGPVRGIPRDHGGGRFGAADCLLCPNGRP